MLLQPHLVQKKRRRTRRGSGDSGSSDSSGDPPAAGPPPTGPTNSARRRSCRALAYCLYSVRVSAAQPQNALLAALVSARAVCGRARTFLVDYDAWFVDAAAAHGCFGGGALLSCARA